jgi:hypothetical protein
MTPFLLIYIVNEIPRLRATVPLMRIIAFGCKVLLKALFKFAAKHLAKERRNATRDMILV